MLLYSRLNSTLILEISTLSFWLKICVAMANSKMKFGQVVVRLMVNFSSLFVDVL